MVRAGRQPDQKRACKVCAIVQTRLYFKTYGCPNCEEGLRLAGADDETLNAVTSDDFHGLVTVADNTRSYVARFFRLDGYVAGVYATVVVGTLPEEAREDLMACGVKYMPRDGTMYHIGVAEWANSKA